MGPSMRITKRLGELERAFSRTVRLVMSDGSERRLPARRLVSAVRDATQHTMSPDVRMILEAVADDCPRRGQGHLGDLIRVLHIANTAVDDTNGAMDASE